MITYIAIVLWLFPEFKALMLSRIVAALALIPNFIKYITLALKTFLAPLNFVLILRFCFQITLIKQFFAMKQSSMSNISLIS